MLNTSQIALAWELFEHGIPKSRIAADLGKTRETIHIWIKGIIQYGLLEFLDRYESAKKGKRSPRKTNPMVKRCVKKARPFQERPGLFWMGLI